MKSPLGRNVVASICFAGGVFLVMAAGSIYSIRQSQAGADSVAHTEEVIARLNGMLALMTGWESANRGYLITGNESYLAPYQNAKTELDGRLAQLQDLVADNPTQLANIAKLRPLLAAKVDHMLRAQTAERQSGFAAAQAIIADGQGKQAMDDIRAITTEMRGNEDVLLAQRRGLSDRQTILSIAAATATAAIGLAVLAIAAIFIHRQLRARIQAQEALELKQAEMQGILENAPLGIFLKDRAGRYRLANAPMRHLLGADAQTCLGKTAEEFFPPERAAQIAQEDRRVLAEGGIMEITQQLPCADGVTRSFHTHKFTVRDASGKVCALGGISEDVTERTRMETELRHALTAAEAASRTKSQFLANMSHELRTPLNSIIGFSEILTDKLFGPLNDKQQQYINNIMKSGRHLLLLINDLLDLAKIEAGKVRLEIETEPVAAVVAEAANLVRGLAERKEVRLDVVPVGAEVTARLDSTRFKQVVYNLLSNAVKFTPKGGKVTLTTQVLTMPVCPPWGGPPGSTAGVPLPGKWLRLAIADNGIGIDPGDLHRIFGEFEQVDSTYARQQEGTGLGLALTTKLVNLHGGCVWAESPGRVNLGSTFYVLLPLTGPPETDPAEIPSAAAPALAPSPSKPGPNGRPLVLIVEDEAAATHIMREHLSKGGYDVAHASTGSEALRLARELRPAAITLDIMLPDANGMDVLARLKAMRETSHIPVIVVSVSDDRNLGLSLGAAEFFVKPVNADRLLSALERMRVKLRREVRDVLVVDDELAARENIIAMLAPRGYNVLAAASGEEALQAVTQRLPDVAIIDLTMPGMSGFELVSLLRQNPITRGLPICIYTAKDLSASEMHWLHEQSTAVTAKPFGDQLLVELRRAGVG